MILEELMDCENLGVGKRDKKSIYGQKKSSMTGVISR